MSSSVESAVVILSDLHYGKETPTYDPDVFQARLQHLETRLIHIRQALQGYVFDELVIAGAGDWVDGSGIFPAQATTQRVANVEQQARDIAAILLPWIQIQQSIWGPARVECVPGNHGRVGDRATHEAASWDLVAYRYLHMLAAPLGIEVHFNEPPNDIFLRPFEVRGHSFLLYHGHEWGRTIKTRQTRVYEWQAHYGRQFDVVISGHYHVGEILQGNRTLLIQAGTFVSDDSHAIRRYGSRAEPMTWAFGVSERRPVTWMFPIYLTA
ncbi:MAG: hypothetical protein KatS3mg060_1148 [Dehalococcoidia bacterium]|nr:MAG: hypothetical protein KatS3mg060_1148 [Dehalococcoidia bacterium]